jgi:hypothetical protein
MMLTFSAFFEIIYTKYILILVLNSGIKFLRAMFDTKEVRSPKSSAYTILNDSERDVLLTAMDALQSYEVRPIPWSKRDSVAEELTA